MNIRFLRDHLKNFQFQKLFVEGLGWENPASPARGAVQIGGDSVPFAKIAEISGVPVLKFDRKAFENRFKAGPKNKDGPKKFHKSLKKQYNKHLALFSDEQSFFTLSYLSREERARTHSYFKGQSGDYFISKLSAVHFGIEDEPKITEIGEKLEQAFDTEKVTKKFFKDFQGNHDLFQKHISGIKTEEEKKWYASLILNRLMFIWFLQKKGFVNGDFDYLQTKLKESKTRGKDRYYSEFLTCLFFEGFAKKPIERSLKAKALLGKIKYLNGGLFVPHAVEEKYKTKIKISDKVFDETFTVFSQYDWQLQGIEGKSDREISPDVMGYIFEKYINALQQKSLGAYYTRDEITQYLSQNAVQKSVLEKVNKKGYEFESLSELLHKLNASLCKLLLTDKDSILNTLTVLDPAVGSGAFLTAAMQELIGIYSPVVGKIETLGDRDLKKWLEDFKDKHKSLAYGIKKNIILKNLYGVDIMKEAAEVCKLRLFLSLVSSALNYEELEPLPNMDFNIMCGNSLIGFLKEGETDDLPPKDRRKSEKAKGDALRLKNGNLQKRRDQEETESKNNSSGAVQMKWIEVLGEDFEQIKDKYNKLVARYKNQPLSFAKLKELKQKTSRFLEENSRKLNLALADKCNSAGVKYPEVLDNEALCRKLRGIKSEKIKRKKKITKERAVRPEDFDSENTERNLNPFHWDLAFNKIMEKGGFDVIITNPPWEKVKIEDKEFFHKYDPSIDKKKTKGGVLKKKKRELLKKPETAKDYKKTSEFYLFQRNYFSGLYQYQSGEITDTDGTKKQASADMDTYRLFTERGFDLLSAEGFLGIVLPSALCKDDGAVGLRKNLLFRKTRIEGLIDFQNQMDKGKGKIFEEVDSRVKFLLLTLQKAAPPDKFPCLFHARDLKILESFPGKRRENQSPRPSKHPSTETFASQDKGKMRKSGAKSLPKLSESDPVKSHKPFPKRKSQDKTGKREKTSQSGPPVESQTVWLSAKEIKKLSPRDRSIIEFKNPTEKDILKKARRFPAVGENLENLWNPVVYREFDETNDSEYFKDKQSSLKDLPLYKGSAVYQYEWNHDLSHVNRFVNSKSNKIQGNGFAFRNKCYKNYRLVIRTIARSNDERSLISAVIPKNRFISNSLHGVHINLPQDIAPEDRKTNGKAGKQMKHTDQEELFLKAKGASPPYLRSQGSSPDFQEAGLKSSRNKYMLLLQAFLNSFVVDYFIRQKISANINKKFITPLHIPRLTEKNNYFKELVERSAKLTCIGREFDELADEIGIPRGGVKDQQERWRIQGEIDAITAYVYDLNPEEFKYILSTFTAGDNQERLSALKKYARQAFRKNRFLDKAS